MEKLIIKVDQLQLGLYVDLPSNWMEHPFFRGSFRLTNEKQIPEIKASGIKEVAYVPSKITSQPLRPKKERKAAALKKQQDSAAQAAKNSKKK